MAVIAIDLGTTGCKSALFDGSEMLASAYRHCLAVADDLGTASLAFPAISTGIYGYPLEVATDIAVATVQGTPSGVEVVRFVCFDDRALTAYRGRL